MPFSEFLVISQFEISKELSSIIIPLTAYSTVQYAICEPLLAMNSIATQSPAFASSAGLFDVNVIILSSVPCAISLPATFREKLPPNLTSTPGSIVNVTPEGTVMLFTTMNGLSIKVQTVSCVITPST